MAAFVIVCAAGTASADKIKRKTIGTDKIETARGKGPPTEVLPAALAALLPLTDDPVLGKADAINGDETTGVVAFTFDDGPNPTTTPAVIDALEKYDVPATFFIVTKRIAGPESTDKHREILTRILDAGFEIGSHSVNHRNMKRATAKIFDKEINESLLTLSPLAKRPIGMFRPPFGAFNLIGKHRLKQLGLTDVRWSIDTRDWQAKAKDAEKLRRKVLAFILKQKGGVVLLHDVKPITARILPFVLDDLEAENCRRLADHQDPIVPVSLHYFLKVGPAARPLPEAVQARTAKYRAALPGRCANRPATALPPIDPPPPPTFVAPIPHPRK